MSITITQEQVDKAVELLGLEEHNYIAINRKAALVDCGEDWLDASTIKVEQPMEDGIYRLVRQNAFMPSQKVTIYWLFEDGVFTDSLGEPLSLERVKNNGYHTIERVADLPKESA